MMEKLITVQSHATILARETARSAIGLSCSGFEDVDVTPAIFKLWSAVFPGGSWLIIAWHKGSRSGLSIANLSFLNIADFPSHLRSNLP